MRRTNDIDAVSDDLTPETRRAVARVGARRGVGADWLNDGAKGVALRAFPLDRSRCSPAAAYAFTALRRVHPGDAAGPMTWVTARFLMGETGLSHPNELLRLAENAYPHQRIPVSVQYLIERIASQRR